MTDTTKNRPLERKVFRNINIFTDVSSYRLPPAGFVSILHRVSGLLMFLLLPFIIWMFDMSLGTEISYDAFTNIFVAGVGFIPAWFVKLVVLALAWGFFHHFVAGVRHLWMDATHSVSKAQGRSTAIATLAISVVLTVLTAGKLFGLY